MEPFLGRDPSTLLAGGGDPSQQLEVLKATGAGCAKVGAETVRGVETDRYRATIDLHEAASRLRREGNPDLARILERSIRSGSDSVTVEAWIDDDGMLRRIREVASLPRGSGRPSATMDIRIDLFDYGIEPAIAVPPAARVYDMTPLLRRKLGLPKRGASDHGGGEESAPPAPKTPFTKRVEGLCEGWKDDLQKLEQRSKGIN
jgi:hypothetical protein